MEDEEFDPDMFEEVTKYVNSLKPDSLASYISKFLSVDFRLGGKVSECFDDGEFLSEEHQSEWCFARVISDEHVIPSVDEVVYYSSRLTLDPDNQGVYPIERVELHGSELTTITPPHTNQLILKNNSKVNLNLSKKAGRGGMYLNFIIVEGSNCEVNMKAEVEDKVREGEFVLKVVGGGNNKIELDLRNLKLKLFKLQFHRAEVNNYIHVKLNKNTDLKAMYWDCEVEGTKIIIEGGKNLNVDELVNNNVDYEVR